MVVLKELALADQQLNMNVLENPAWYALNSHHFNLGLFQGKAARYQVGVFSVGAVSDQSRAAFEDLRGLLAEDETIYAVGPLPEELSGWQVLSQANAPQVQSSWHRKGNNQEPGASIFPVCVIQTMQ